MNPTAHEVTSLDQDLLSCEELSVRGILEVDRARHYKGEERSAAEMYDLIPQRLATGAKLYRAGNTLFLTATMAPGEAEFHTCNADSKQQLVVNFLAYATLLKHLGCNRLITFYDHEPITELFRHTPFPFKVERVELGKYRTFRATIGL